LHENTLVREFQSKTPVTLQPSKYAVNGCAEVLAHYRGLWQVVASLRITKHDVKMRPIDH
jgi:hypothetical protein